MATATATAGAGDVATATYTAKAAFVVGDCFPVFVRSIDAHGERYSLDI
jgi:hypothetical protein